MLLFGNFILENSTKGYIVHHKDGNPHNNNFENLECISREEHNKIPKKPMDMEKQRVHLERIQELAKNGIVQMKEENGIDCMELNARMTREKK